MNHILYPLARGVGSYIDSPAKIQDILKELFPNKKERKKYIKNNISEYATGNELETAAELVALVTSPGYKRGTLRKELEEHVDALFHHKGRKP